jgi:hypothetical protein
MKSRYSFRCAERLENEEFTKQEFPARQRQDFTKSEITEPFFPLSFLFAQG